MILRTATQSDLPAIRQIALATWPATYGNILSQEQLNYMLETMYSTDVLTQQMESGHRFIMAEQNGTSIGFAGFSEGDTADIYKLHKLYVLPDTQKTGAGKALVNRIIALSVVAGATVLQLNVNRFNNARLFYERHGFQVIREEDIAIGNGYYMNDYVMEYTL
jgi:N-acetylglutamate synthase-like GNAT family acetyltransferase